MNALFERLTGLTLLHPWWLLAALLVPAALWLRRRAGAPSVVFGPAPLAFTEGATLPATTRTRLVALPRVLQALGLLAAVVALARPVRRDPLPLETEGIDIVLALDVSSSMANRDMEERTRLDVAKEAAARFVAGRPHDRIGLVCFARYPDVRCPPTLDHAALRAFLADVAPVESDGAEDATGIGTAVARAAQVLRSSAARSTVVILLSDGAENVATALTPQEIAPRHAGQLCETLGVRVYTIAAGSTATGGEETKETERLSERTGGRFYAAQDAEAVARVYASIDALEKVKLAEPRWRVEERFLPFLAAATGLVLAALLLRTTVLDVLP